MIFNFDCHCSLVDCKIDEENVWIFQVGTEYCKDKVWPDYSFGKLNIFQHKKFRKPKQFHAVQTFEW